MPQNIKSTHPSVGPVPTGVTVATKPCCALNPAGTARCYLTNGHPRATDHTAYDFGTDKTVTWPVT